MCASSPLEPTRHEVLADSRLLDASAEEAFDRLTRLACRLLNAPVALVSLVDGHRQFFKSACGLSKPWASQRETPLVHSFCKHVVEAEDLLVIEDTRANGLTSSNPGIEEMGVAAYLGVPLKTPEGWTMGSFCAIDREPRTWSQDDVEHVQALAACTMTEIALRLKVRALEHEERERAAEPAVSAAAIDALLDIFFVLSEEGQPVRWNEQMREVTGYADEEIQAMHATDFFAVADQPRVGEAIARILVEGEAIVEAHLQTKSGEKIPYELNGRALRDEAGQLLGICGTGRDLTERRETEERLSASESRFRSFVEAMAHVVWRADAKGEVTELSEAWQEFTGQTHEEVSGWGWMEAVHPEDHARVTAEWTEHLASRQVLDTEYRVRRYDGDYHWFSVRAVPVFGEDGSVFEWVGTCTHIDERKRAEAALRESERRLRTLIETAQEGVWILGAEGETTFVNERMAEMLGYAPEEMIGLPVEAFMDEAHRVRAQEYLERRKRGIREDYDIRFRRRDGSDLWTIVSATPSTDERGRFAGTVKMVTDITERKRAEEALGQSKLRYERLVNGIDGIVWEGAIDTRTGEAEYVFVSDRLRTVLGYEPETWVEDAGRWREAIVEEDRAEVLEVSMKTATGRREDHTMEYRMRAADGRIVWLRDIVSVLGEQDGKSVIGGIMIDVTDRRVYEEALLEAKRQAEQARREAEEMAKVKSSLLNNMSHEIRTPLTTVLGFADVLAEEISGEHSEIVQMIQGGGHRLLRTLNSVLDLAQIESGTLKMSPKWLDVAREVQDVAMLFEEQAKAKGVTLRCEVPPEPLGVEVDQGALQRVLMNLVSNAVKFTTEGHVIVRAEHGPATDAEGADAREVVLTVEDTGIGMGEAFVSKVFDEFQQESSGLAREHEGSGLGLAIVKGLVSHMGGEVEVESQKGRGSTFRLRLPMASSTPRTAYGDGPSGEKVPRWLDRRVLLVEDNAQARALIKRLLQKTCEVKAVGTAEEALQEARRTSYDVLLLDISLGGSMSGTDVLEALREEAAYKGVPAVALTAHATSGAKREILEAGFDAYLAKPFSSNRLRELVDRLAGSTSIE